VSGPLVPDALLPAEAEDFLVWLAAEKGRSPATLAAYRLDLRRWVAHLEDAGLVLSAVRPGDVDGFVEVQRRAGRAPSTIARCMVAVRGLHRFLEAEGVVASDPTAEQDAPRVPRGLPKALPEQEVTRLLDAVVGDDPRARRDRAVLEVLYGTGIRISELVGLSLADVDLEAQLLKVFGKGSKERIVPVGRMARVSLLAWLEPGGRDLLAPARWARRGDAEAVFLNARGGRLTRQGAWGIVRRHGEAVGLGDRLSPHVLRHSCATHMLDHGADIRTVQELLGHASISTTQVYTRVSTERLWQAYRLAHPRAVAALGVG
jgi:integrase/recombinase XerD